MAKLALERDTFAPLQGPETSVAQRPLRIAFFTETFLPKIDGVVTRLCQTIRHLRAAGHDVLVIAPDGKVEEFEGARIHGVPGVRFPLYPDIKLAVPRPSVGKELAAFKPDLIHAAQPMFLGMAALYYGFAHKVPLVISYHAQIDRYLHYYKLGFLEPMLWRGTKSVYNGADLVLCTSRAMKDLLQEQGVQRVELWQRGVDTEFFHPQQASQEMRARLTQGHPEEKLLLYIGRLSAEKGLGDCRPVLEALPGVRLALVGDGPHRSKLEQYFAGTPTFFAGYLKGTELASAYASADVFLMPSRTETLGLVLLEAMAAGCPVVAAAEGGIVDIVWDGVTGHLYKCGDRAAAISAVRQLVSDSAYRETMRREARLDAEQWSWAAATRQLESFYRDLMTREQEISLRFAQDSSPDASMDSVCEALQVSRATVRRHTRLREQNAAGG